MKKNQKKRNEKKDFIIYLFWSYMMETKIDKPDSSFYGNLHNYKISNLIPLFH